MAEELEVLPPEPSDEEEGGGPVKSFLEHLEDLRWTLIKCAAAIMLGIIVCLGACNFITHLLLWPLIQAKKVHTSGEPQIALTLGTNLLGKFAAKEFPIAGLATNHDSYFRIAPVTIGTNTLLAVVTDPNPPTAATDAVQLNLAIFSPAEAFTVAVQVAIYGGFTVSAPFVIFFLGQFILPALHMHEKRFLYRVSGFASFLFLAGVAFCYFVMMVITLSTTVGFANWLGFASETWRASEYISFMCWFLLGMGLSFELPLVLLTLVKLGILDAAKLSKFRMYWVVAGLAIAGFVTPDGNPLTMVLMFLPLHFLYEVSVAVAWWWERKDREASATEVGS
jgi:sec-independent protein translocase protein TatC